MSECQFKVENMKTLQSIEKQRDGTGRLMVPLRDFEAELERTLYKALRRPPMYQYAFYFCPEIGLVQLQIPDLWKGQVILQILEKL